MSHTPFARRSTVVPVLKLLRLALLGVLALLMIEGVVLGLGAKETGPVEKIALVVYAGLLVLAALKVNTIGRRRSSKRRTKTSS